MSRVQRIPAPGIALIALILLLTLPDSTLAHERRRTGSFEMVVGWGDEPPLVGFRNSVQAVLRDPAGKPIRDLGDALKVEIFFGSLKIGPLPLIPASETSGTPGEYRAAIIPTRPGNYTFHFIGSVRGQKVDQSFVSSDRTFDPVIDPREIEFPARDPSRAELAGRLERVAPRVDALGLLAREARDAASLARRLAIVGIVLGAAGLLASLGAGRMRARP